MSQFKRFRLLVLLSLLLICPQDLRGQLADLVADINEDTRGGWIRSTATSSPRARTAMVASTDG